MPPRRGTRATKILKENVDVVKKNRHKSDTRVPKPPRQALADKTNSLSDDNASLDIPIKTSKKPLKVNAAKTNEKDSPKPKRERRLPPRYVDNQVLLKLSSTNDSPARQSLTTPKPDTPKKNSEKSLSFEAARKDSKSKKAIKTLMNESNSVSAKTFKSNKQKPVETNRTAKKVECNTDISSKQEKITVATRSRRTCRQISALGKQESKANNSSVLSSFKTPPKDLDSSLVTNRPKRICRLPSKFEDHSISPNKFIPVQPCHASTPILQKNAKPFTKHIENVNFNKGAGVKTKQRQNKDKSADEPHSKNSQMSIPSKTVHKVNSSSNSSMDKSSPDSNNNGKNKIIRPTRINRKTKLQTKEANHEVKRITPFVKRLIDKTHSFRILDDDRQSNKGKNLDVYEFTFDPNEEPPPQKKKRKRTVKKNQAKPKAVILKSNYNHNVSKALTTLKSKIKPSKTQPVQSNAKPIENYSNPTAVENVPSTQPIDNPATCKDIPQSNNFSVDIGLADQPNNESAVTSIHKSNYASICVEDIAADFAASDHHDINYSPVSSPIHPAIPESSVTVDSHINPVLNKDPLNLQEDLSFFEEQPVASSSMNVSVRHPLASPWRVEFGSLPMKWHSNTYVKPNMTPAVECSFINSENLSTKKHVYTNIVPEEPLPEKESTAPNAPNLHQPSIISFMREVAERSANKKRRRQSHSPTKVNSIFDDLTNANDEFGYKTPKKAKKAGDKSAQVTSSSHDRSNEKENSDLSTNISVSHDTGQKKDKDGTYFGFDDSENVDQENISPVKVFPNTRARGLASRGVLKQLNAITGPTRAIIPAAKPKLTSSEVAEQLYDQLKIGEDAQQVPDKEPEEPADNTMATDVNDPSWHENEDSQSVHLFEDIEVVHHSKPHRKSYGGKAKKVTFSNQADSDSDSQPLLTAQPDQSSEDDLADLPFEIPNVKPKKTMKKKKPKKLLTKKEEKEVEEWAAGFNSMCEDIDEFPLVVE